MKALALVAVLAIACKDDPSDFRVAFEYEFDAPISAQQLAEATRLIERRVGPFGVVRRKGQIITVRLDLEYAVPVQRAIIPRTATLELRIEDSSAEYMRTLGKHVERDEQLAKLDVDAVTDLGMTNPKGPIDHYLRAEDGIEYVNEKLADRIGCDKKDRIAGTGYPCWLTGKQKLDAALYGDAELFVEPLDASLAIPADREVLLEKQKLESYKYAWRTRFVLRAPIVVDAKSIRGARLDRAPIGKPQVLRVGITEDVMRALSKRPPGWEDDSRILWVADGNTRVIEVDANKRELAITGELEELASLEYAIAFSRFPAKLVEVTTPPRGTRKLSWRDRTSSGN